MVDIFADQKGLLERSLPLRTTGRVVEVMGLTVTAEGLSLPVGSLCEIQRRDAEPVAAQVVGVRGPRYADDPAGADWGANARPRAQPLGTSVCAGRTRHARLCGRRPWSAHRWEGRVHHRGIIRYSATRRGRCPGDRLTDRCPPVFGSSTPCTPWEAGSAFGIFAGTGVGKSILLGMIARSTAADVTIAALVGERGREVGDFIRRDLGEEGMKRTVLVVSTSDESPVLRVRAGFVATAIAE